MGVGMESKVVDSKDVRPVVVAICVLCEGLVPGEFAYDLMGIVAHTLARTNILFRRVFQFGGETAAIAGLVDMLPKDTTHALWLTPGTRLVPELLEEMIKVGQPIVVGTCT